MAQASVIKSLRLTARALPQLLSMALPWLAAFGLIGLIEQAQAWTVARLIMSVGACAILLICARTVFEACPLPYWTRPERGLAIYLLWWMPLAFALFAVGNLGPWIGLAFICCLFGRLSLTALLRALQLPGSGPWQLRTIFATSIGTLATFALLPAVMILLTIPILGGIALTGVDLAFLEADLPSMGGPLSAAGLASEMFSALLSLLAAASVGFYQGAVLRDWQAQSQED